MSSYAYKVLTKAITCKIPIIEAEDILKDWFFNKHEESECIQYRNISLISLKDHLKFLYGDKCVFCNIKMNFVKITIQNKLTYLDTATIEHILPKAKGGISHIDNYCLSCGKCNNKKRDNLLPYDLFKANKKAFEIDHIDEDFDMNQFLKRYRK